MTVQDVVVDLPDVAPVDNQMLGVAALRIVRAMKDMRDVVGDSVALRRLTVELAMKFAGEFLPEGTILKILEGTFDEED